MTNEHKRNKNKGACFGQESELNPLTRRQQARAFFDKTLIEI